MSERVSNRQTDRQSECERERVSNTIPCRRARLKMCRFKCQSREREREKREREGERKREVERKRERERERESSCPWREEDARGADLEPVTAVRTAVLLALLALLCSVSQHSRRERTETRSCSTCLSVHVCFAAMRCAGALPQQQLLR